jgi:hypothetical protein
MEEKMAIHLKKQLYRRENDDVVLSKIVQEKSISLADALYMASEMLYSKNFLLAKVELWGETELVLSQIMFTPGEAAESGFGPEDWEGFWYTFSQPSPALPAPSYHNIFQLLEMVRSYAPEAKPTKEKTT